MGTTFRCPECYAVLSRKAELEEHAQLAHGEHPEGIGEISGHLGALSGQMPSDMGGPLYGRSGPWRCRACGTEFAARSEWEDHLRMAHIP